MKKALAFIVAALGVVAVLATSTPSAGAVFGGPRYELTITNLTDGQPMTPPVFAVDDEPLELFGLQQFASPGLRQIAENGNLAPLAGLLALDRSIDDSGIASGSGADGEGPVPPGASRTVVLRADGYFGRQLSAVSMIVCTNDGFTGIDDIDLPIHKDRPVTIYAMAYDAGTEINTEDLDDLVPPCSGGETGTATSNPALAENGRITAHGGITGAVDLDPDVWGFSNPVAKFTVTRVS